MLFPCPISFLVVDIPLHHNRVNFWIMYLPRRGQIKYFSFFLGQRKRTMFIIYRQEVDKAPEYVAAAYSREDAMLKMITTTRRRTAIGAGSGTGIGEEKYFIIDRTVETPSGLTVDEFKQVTEMVDEGWILSNIKPRVKNVLVAKYYILEVPSSELRSKGIKCKIQTVYDADEIIELLRRQGTCGSLSPSLSPPLSSSTSSSLLAGGHGGSMPPITGDKVYNSLIKANAEQRTKVFSWCLETLRASEAVKALPSSDVLNVMGCLKELEGDRVGRYEYFKRSAEMGNLLGIRNLAAYFDKVGKLDEATMWYTKAIEMGDVASMLSIASVYGRNLTIKGNKEKCTLWKAKHSAAVENNSQ